MFELICSNCKSEIKPGNVFLCRGKKCYSKLEILKDIKCNKYSGDYLFCNNICYTKFLILNDLYCLHKIY